MPGVHQCDRPGGQHDRARSNRLRADRRRREQPRCGGEHGRAAIEGGLRCPDPARPVRDAHAGLGCGRDATWPQPSRPGGASVHRLGQPCGHAAQPAVLWTAGRWRHRHHEPDDRGRGPRRADLGGRNRGVWLDSRERGSVCDAPGEPGAHPADGAEHRLQPGKDRAAVPGVRQRGAGVDPDGPQPGAGAATAQPRRSRGTRGHRQRSQLHRRPRAVVNVQQKEKKKCSLQLSIRPRSKQYGESLKIRSAYDYIEISSLLIRFWCRPPSKGSANHRSITS